MSRLAALCALLAASACGDDAPPPPTDGGTRDSPGLPDASQVTPPEPPAPPMLAPCPLGWIETALDDLPGAVACEPWAAGLAPCAANEARFPGDPACVRVGGPCPADGFAEDLPTTGSVVFVRGGSVAGDGSRAMPFATIGEGLAAAPSGATVAIAPATYDEVLRITRPVTLAGACTDVVLAHRGGVRIASAGVVLSRLRVDGAFVGVAVELAASVELRGVEISEPQSAGLQTMGGQIVGEDVLVRDGVDAGLTLLGGSASLSRVAIVRNGGPALVNDGGQLELSETSVTDGAASGPFPALLDASGGLGMSTLDGVAAIGNPTSEVAVFDHATVIVRNSLLGRRPATASPWPFGITAADGARVELERVRIESVLGTAVGTTATGSSINATDVIVRQVGVTDDRRSGPALEVSAGATANVERIAVVGCTAVSVLVTGVGSRAEITDLAAFDTEPAADGRFGRAIQVQLGGTAIVERALIARHSEIGAAAAYEGSSLELRDVHLSETRCAPAACPGPGIGIGAYLGAHVVLERFLIENNELAGIQIALDGEADLADGVIAGNPVGVNVQVVDYDLSRLTDRVVYRDNGTNLDATTLPVPEPAAP